MLIFRCGGEAIYYILLLFSLSSLVRSIIQTEIDKREPKSFVDSQFKYLNVRHEGFDTLICQNNNGDTISIKVPSWGMFGTRYDYDSRNRHCLCPMTPQGIATMVDWALLVPCLFGNVRVPPSTIFVHTYMLSHFIENILHYMNKNHRFVLITGGSETTIPRAVDVRFKPMRGFSTRADGGEYFQKLLNDSRIVHWFCENHDLIHPKISTLPTALTTGNAILQELQESPLPLWQRPLKFLVADRLHSGKGPYALRSDIIKRCQKSPQSCHHPVDMTFTTPGELPHDHFVQEVRSLPFVACVHGGGLDPSPKAWEAILYGTIPIVQHGPLDDAYEQLPVMFVHSWSELFRSPQEVQNLLFTWLQKLAPFYEENSVLRNQTLHKLTTQYWMEQVRQRMEWYYHPPSPSYAPTTFLSNKTTT